MEDTHPEQQLWEDVDRPRLKDPLPESIIQEFSDESDSDEARDVMNDYMAAFQVVNKLHVAKLNRGSRAVRPIAEEPHVSQLDLSVDNYCRAQCDKSQRLPRA